MPTIPDKTCTTCGQVAPMTAEHFRPDARYRCGFMPRCRGCQRADARRTRERDIEAHAARVRAWYETNPDANARHCRATWAKRKGAYNQRRREARAAAPEAQRAVERAHYQRNREKVLAHNRNYAARKRGADGTHSSDDVTRLLAAQSHRCHWCGGKLGDRYDVDHRIPLSRGGSNDPSNLVIACPTCNRSKSARTPLEWAGRLF